MGGGDLNTKKTWHPSTMKNQERVWKAEQAAAEEKKRIIVLERERAQERDREELNALAKQNVPSSSESNDNRLRWMYDKPDKKVQDEDYLLGKAIDRNFDQAGKSDQNEIPAVSRRVVGSSMITTAGDVQVDLARKLREDPLLLVKERERAARAALLNNPVQRRKLTELLRKEQEQKNLIKGEKKAKKKDNTLDNLLAAKLNALGGEKGMDIAKLLESDDSSSDEETKKKKKKKKKNKKQKSRKGHDESDDELSQKGKKLRESKSYHRSSDNSDKECSSKVKKRQYSSRYENSNKSSSLKRKSSDSSSDEGNSYKKNRKDFSPKRYWDTEKQNLSHESCNDRKYLNKDYKKYDYDNKQSKIRDKDLRDKQEIKKTGLSQEEKAARLASMIAAGAEREVQRGRRVAEQRAENAAPEKSIPRHSSRNEARVLPDSLESRIHSNRHYIQRNQRHMNEHFARR
ncbi:pre-mRNA-splicing factor CWC25 homolog [Vanessa tameamea]|uniref:Pre-mRNA-splicing factor CWC25 homolog n=1 Tax=Vanessa tameamea TaxID=334116 RepID=A0A8B8HRL7_VANTA|nr:pre-mRNA-splicing factor CWC25 homolog [Vanessa tameamea]